MMEPNETSASGLVIRGFDAARAADAAAFCRLNVEWLEKYFVVEPDDHTVLHDPVREIIAPGGTILLADVAGETVGCCALIVMPGDPGTLEIAKLAVTAGFQGRQIGRKLMEATMAAARAQGAERVVLVTNSGLRAARQLYESMQFTYLSREAAGPLAHYERGDTFMEKSLRGV